jgi:catechol 2,3-dioxygenase-like lactoylglutathione lyase family enzyme
MNVQRICFLGTRTGNFEATATLFRDVLGLQNTHAEPGWSVFQLPSGRSDFVEVFGPEHDNASVFPTEVRDGVVVAFAVDDIVGAREELAAAGVELVGEIVWAAELFESPGMEGFGWFFFRAPDGNIYVMQEDSRPVAT